MCFQCGSASAQEHDDKTPNDCEPAAARATSHRLKIVGIRVLKGEAPQQVGDKAAGLAAGKSKDHANSAGLAAGGTDSSETAKTFQPLYSSSDLQIVVTEDSYVDAVAIKNKCNAELHLFFNGVDVTHAVMQFGQELDADAHQVKLTYHVGSNAEAGEFWKALYRENGIGRPAALRIAFGWPDTGPNSESVNIPQIWAAVAPPTRRWLAIGMLIATAVSFLLLLAYGDTFRDSAPPWLDIARKYRGQSNDPQTLQAFAQKVDPLYIANQQVYPDFAQAVVAGATVESGDFNKAAAALIVSDCDLPRPTFSLSRVQLGAWFVFAVATGIFLFIVFDDLPPISGSVLALLGISVSTASVSVAVEPKKSEGSSWTSRGFFADLVTGFDDNQQIHRYQAVVINMMLLLVGLHFTWENLAFPVFDDTWLAFLGVSGAAFAAGKKVMETT
jgi:hypothetical protein